jgi:hypothetical protein
MIRGYLGHNAEVGQAISETATILRLIVCGSCRTVFTVCTSCFRGQRYCSQTCRDTVRRSQRRAADRRYQQNERGKQAHCHRQRKYRERKAPLA